MKIISTKKALVKIIQDKKKLGFIPTMGAIHKAHVFLIKKSVHLCNKTIVSIFVNKPQFSRGIDFQKYPRVIKKDISLLKKHNVDYLFIPSNKEIYPRGQNKKIKISTLAKQLCGKFRPGHFKAVVDVIDRFLKLIKPSKIFLGEKDLQQLKIIEEFIFRNKISTKVVSCKTIREKNGIPCSSRNSLLSPHNKIIASKIYKLIVNKKKYLVRNKRLLKVIKKKILSIGASKIDYIEILDINKITKPYKKIKKNKIFIAYYIDQVRLIDNI